MQAEKNTIKRKRNIKYSSAMAAFWFLNGVLTIFLVPLLSEQGFSDSQTGILLAVRAMSSVVFQPFYSSIADRIVSHFPLKYMISLLVLAGMAVTAVHAFCPLSFPLAVLIFIGYGASINCVSSMLDAMSVQYAVSSYGVNYTVARAIGSFSWAVSSMALGRMIQAAGHYRIVLYVQMISLLVLLALTLFLDVPERPAVQEHHKDDTAHHSIGYIFVHHPHYTLLLISVVLVFLAQNIVMSYLINKITLVGGGTQELGIAQALLAIAEIFVPLYYKRLKKRFGVDRVVELALAFTVIRIIVIAMAPNVYVIYMAQITQAMACLYWSGNVDYVYQHIEEGDRIKGQGILSAAQSGFAVCTGSVIAGQMLTYVGAEGLYRFAWICALAGLLVLLAGNKIIDLVMGKKAGYSSASMIQKAEDS